MTGAGRQNLLSRSSGFYFRYKQAHTFSLEEVSEHLAKVGIVRLLIEAQTAAVLQVLCKLVREAAAQGVNARC